MTLLVANILFKVLSCVGSNMIRTCLESVKLGNCLRGINTLSGEADLSNTCSCFFCPSEKGSTLKENNSLPRRAICFVFE